MAFCSSCGASIVLGTRFCNKCGAARSNSAGKVGAAVVMAILGLAPAYYLAWQVVQHTTRSRNRIVETPFVPVETNEDLEEAVHYLGVERYPGTRVLKEGATSAGFGAVHGASLNFETGDSVEKVCSFYSSRHPNASVATFGASRCMMDLSNQRMLTTITITAHGNTTKILITSAPKKSGGAVN